MITIKQLFEACGLETPHDQIKLVRHVGHPKMSITEMIEDGGFEFYQAEQLAKVEPYKNCRTIFSFLGQESKFCVLHGVYHVKGKEELSPERIAEAPEFLTPEFLKDSLKSGRGRIFYDLEEDLRFREWRGRLRVKWKNPRCWVQRVDLEIFEVLAPGRVGPFPGYQAVILSRAELKSIMEHPDSHPDWVAAMKHTAAVYRIVDMSDGAIYIGSATGRQGLWSRWNDYAKTGHGGNQFLKGRDPSKFRWSIVRTVSGSMSRPEVIRLEQIEKEKHGSRAVGLNVN